MPSSGETVKATAPGEGSRAVTEEEGSHAHSLHHTVGLDGELVPEGVAVSSTCTTSYGAAFGQVDARSLVVCTLNYYVDEYTNAPAVTDEGLHCKHNDNVYTVCDGAQDAAVVVFNEGASAGCDSAIGVTFIASSDFVPHRRETLRRKDNDLSLIHI